MPRSFNSCRARTASVAESPNFERLHERMGRSPARHESGIANFVIEEFGPTRGILESVFIIGSEIRLLAEPVMELYGFLTHLLSQRDHLIRRHIVFYFIDVVVNFIQLVLDRVDPCPVRSRLGVEIIEYLFKVAGIFPEVDEMILGVKIEAIKADGGE